MPPRPHKLALYEQAVQHPLAEVAFLERAFAHHHRDAPALLLGEDFAGTASVAAAWCLSHPDRQAVAVDAHGPTVRWAARHHRDIDDLHLLHADVLDVRSPRVDIIAALNFSTFIYHDTAALVAYLRHARRRLRRPGMLVLDAFGGPGAMRPATQQRPFPLDLPATPNPSPEPPKPGPEPREGPDPLTPDPQPTATYLWEQRRYDAATGRIDCRIHFRLPDGRERRNAFRYDWRLWTLPELTAALHAAGFATARVWCDRYDPAAGTSDGRYRPTRALPNREDWIAYLTATRE